MSGDLMLQPSAAFAGEWSFSARDEGALSVGHDAPRPLILSASSFTAYHPVKVRAGADSGIMGIGAFPAIGDDNETVTGHGTIEVSCATSCEVLLFGGPGSIFTLRGTSAGTFLAEDAPIDYTGWSGEAGNENDFYYRVPDHHLPIGGGSLQGAVAQASGDFGLFISNATVKATLANGSSISWVLSREYQRTALAPNGPTIVQMRDELAVFHLEEGSFEADDAKAVLHAAPRAQFAGEVSARASGEMVVDGSARDLVEERMLLRGTLDFSHLTGDATTDPILRSRELHSIEASFSGTAERVRVASEEIVRPPALTPAARISLAAFLLTVLALLLWIPLYSRLDRARVLANPSRARILEILRASPGLTAPALAREIGKARAVAIHHLAMLEGHRFVAHRRVGWAIHYYLPEGAPDAGSMLTSLALADATRRRIAVEVARGVATQSDLVAATGASQRLVSYHLGKLKKAGLVQAMEGRPRRFAPTTPLLECLRGEIAVRA